MGGSEQADTPGHRQAADDDRTSRPAWVRVALFLGRPPALTRRQWRVLGLVAMASFFEMYDLSLFALTLKQIQADLAIPEASLGVLGSLVRLGAFPACVVASSPIASADGRCCSGQSSPTRSSQGPLSSDT